MLSTVHDQLLDFFFTRRMMWTIKLLVYSQCGSAKLPRFKEEVAQEGKCNHKLQATSELTTQSLFIKLFEYVVFGTPPVEPSSILWTVSNWKVDTRKMFFFQSVTRVGSSGGEGWGVPRAHRDTQGWRLSLLHRRHGRKKSKYSQQKLNLWPSSYQARCSTIELRGTLTTKQRALSICQNWPASPGHSHRNEDFTFNEN